MKTVGMIGGVGPESTVDYYRMIIAEYRKQRPDDSYPPILINSINLTKMVAYLENRQLEPMTEELSLELQKLARAGADFAILASNTPHLVFDELSRRSQIPLISIVEATRQSAIEGGFKKLGLLGSRFTMQAKFYPEVFAKAGIGLAMPNPEEQTYIHQRYMDELVKGVFLPQTRDGLLRIANRLKEEEGIQALILGGTELPLILRASSARNLPFLDTAQIHVQAIVHEILA